MGTVLGQGDSPRSWGQSPLMGTVPMNRGTGICSRTVQHVAVRREGVATTPPSCPVLVVEDDETYRKGLVVALDQNHFAVTVASDGSEAIEILGQRPFQMVILDLNLPSTSGLEVLDFIRNHREKVAAKVIIVTAATDARTKYDIRVAEEVLLKPVDFSYVAERARKYCGH
jgi:CheY-like chemotaxis protein